MTVRFREFFSAAIKDNRIISSEVNKNILKSEFHKELNYYSRIKVNESFSKIKRLYYVKTTVLNVMCQFG